MGIDSALDRPSRLGAATALGTTVGILTLCLIFQFVVPAQLLPEGASIGGSNSNVRSLILYATSGGIHLLLCGGSIVFFWEQLRKGESKAEFANILVYACITISVILLVMIFACYLDLKVVVHSYEERVRPLEADPRLAVMLTRHAIPLTQVRFQPFALFPLILVVFGVTAAVMACFWIAHKAIVFSHRADDLKKLDILELKRSLTQLIGLITVVFTTSTIATIALMQIGRDWVEKGSMRDAYIQNGHAMAIFWSACYTTLIVLIIVLPLWWIARHTRRIQRQARHSGARPTLYDQIFEIVSYKSVTQVGIATLAPLLTSSIAAVFGS